MTLRRPFALCLVLAVAIAAVAAATAVEHSMRAHQRAHAAAAEAQRWQTGLASFTLHLRVPDDVQGRTKPDPQCQPSATDFCWRSALLPARVDLAVVTAVRAAGGRETGHQFDPINRGCQPPPHPDIPGACTHAFALAGGVILVELFPHHVFNAKAPLTFNGSDININATPPSQAAGLAN